MKRATETLVLLLVLSAPVVSQVQQIAQAPYASRDIARILGLPPGEPGKCGTTAIVLAFSEWNRLSSEKREAIARALQRPTLQKERVSPTGKFRIHYDTTGVNEPALISGGLRDSASYERYVDSVAFYFEQVWKFEVDSLGYIAPPSDGQQGGGPEYDIYIEDIGTDFGRTSWVPSSDIVENGSRQRFTTYTEIENDFAGYRTPGMDGLRVTAAHEFFHAVQIGSYGVWTTTQNADFYFNEISSVWMEHAAFPDIHDYYYYLPKFFQLYRDSQEQSLPFTTYTWAYGGYERCVWAFFLAKRFGKEIIKEIWTGTKQAPVLPSTQEVLHQHGSSLEAEFALFNTWNYFTADRANPALYYDEGEFYPRYEPNISVSVLGNTSSISTSAPAMSTQQYEFALGKDTVTAVVTNVDIESAQNANPPMSVVGLKVSPSGNQPPYQSIGGGLGILFVVDDSRMWRVQYLRASTLANAVVTLYAGPNPLRLGSDLKLVLPISAYQAKRADVYFVNSALELVFSRAYDIQQRFGRTVVEVPTTDLRAGLPSGIYHVMAKCGADEFKWKIAIVQ